jgi:SAM-dependent methyltransferase
VTSVDRRAHNELYAATAGAGLSAPTPSDYLAAYEARHMTPFHAGGTTKGYVRGLATRRLLARLEDRRPGDAATILDAGCGTGELSRYLACRGHRVVAVDLSEVGCELGRRRAVRLGLGPRCRFIVADLSCLPLRDESVDFVIGHASLHHFIKDPGAAAELRRVMRAGAEGFFADSFGENPLFALLRTRRRMRRLGDVPLTRSRILRFFREFRVTLEPTDWFVMLDKLYLRLCRGRAPRLLRRLSRLHFALDRRVPAGSRLSLGLAGAVLTTIRKPTAG